MTHYTTALTGYKPICGSESEADLWTKDIELTDCPRCLELLRKGTLPTGIHFVPGPGGAEILFGVSGTDAIRTIIGSAVTCPACLEKMAQGILRESVNFDFVAADRSWPKLDPPGSFGTKECLIADWLLDDIKHKLEKSTREYYSRAVANYLAFMQACHLRQLIGRQQRDNNPMMVVSSEHGIKGTCDCPICKIGREILP